MVTIDHYNHFVELMGDFATTYGGWPNDSLIIILLDSSHTRTLTNTLYSEVSANELATGNGYTQKTEALTSVTSAESSGTWTLDAADASWTASGGDIGPATDAVILDDTITSPADALLFDIDFEASETAGDGTDFIIAFNASGICTIT